MFIPSHWASVEHTHPSVTGALNRLAIEWIDHLMCDSSGRSTRRRFLAAIGAFGTASVPGCLDDDDGSVEPSETPTPKATPTQTPTSNGYRVETVVDGFSHPWGMAVVPGEASLLVTELGGTLSLVDSSDGTITPIDGVPEVHASGQGGLLDVEVHPDTQTAPVVYLTYVATDGDGASATHLARGRLDLESGSLDDTEVLYVVEPFSGGTQHYGSRVVVDDGYVYLTSGDRGDKTFDESHQSQDLTTGIGSTIRLTDDGAIPEDNPFVDDPAALDELYSYGHRNAQGLTIHPETGALWSSEHGERDGDALHIIESGGNYGWPIAHTGCAYGTTDPVGDDPFDRDDIVEPVYHWPCTSGGFPPAGMTFYNGEAFADWQGDLFVGNLAGRYLGRFNVEGREVEEVDALLADRGWRIRDVTVEPDTGHLLVAVDDDPAPLIRIVPE